MTRLYEKNHNDSKQIPWALVVLKESFFLQKNYKKKEKTLAIQAIKAMYVKSYIKIYFLTYLLTYVLNGLYELMRP